VALFIVKEVTLVAPILTEVASEKFVPEIVNELPIHPLVEDIPDIVGGCPIEEILI
jgi:hypothetical protein